jgi:hypothetical protein
MKLSRRINILIILLAILTIALAITGCKNTVTVYFSKPTYHVILDNEGAQKQIVPNVVTRPRGKSYSLTSLNTTIAKVENDGKTVTALREGAVTLRAEVDGVIGTCSVLIYASPDSPVIPNNIDDKISVYFVTEEGFFPSQRIRAGEYATDPSNAYTRPGYQLFGWYTSPEYKEGMKFDFENTPITKTTTLYALWGISPENAKFKFETVDGKAYVAGFAHSYIPYGQIILPATNEQDVPVEGVKSYSFSENKHATRIVIPDSYKYIGRYAFNEMAKLTSVEIGTGIEQIDEGAFADNEILQTVEINGTNALSIGNSSFMNCVKLDSLSIPDTTTSIGERAFYNAKLLTEFTTPTSLQTIGEFAFYNNGLTSIDLKNIETIGDKAFWGCKNLATVTNGTQLKSLGSYVFGQLTTDSQNDATLWLRSKNNNNPNVIESNLIYIGDMLVYAYNMVKPSYSVKASTKYLASRCFADTPNAIIKFLGETPPIGIGKYVFGDLIRSEVQSQTQYEIPSDIIVPMDYPGKNFMKDYIEAFLVLVPDPDEPLYTVPTQYSFATVNRFYQQAITTEGSSAIEIYTRYEVRWIDKLAKIWEYQGRTNGQPNTSGDDLPKLRLLIGGWNLKHPDTTNNQPVELDIRKVTEKIAREKNGSSNPWVVDRVVSNAFQQLNNVQKIYMPVKILKIEKNAFSSLTNCKGIYFGLGEDDAGSWIPRDTIIDKHSFNFSQMPNCKIYVPTGRSTDYKAAWADVKNLILEY